MGGGELEIARQGRDGWSSVSKVNFISCPIGGVKQPPVIGRACDDELICFGI